MTDVVDLNDQDLPDTDDLDSYVVLPYAPSDVQDDEPTRGAVTNFFARLLSPIRSYTAARAWAANQVANPSQNWSNQCQKFSRSCVNAAAWANSALNAWAAIPASHKHSGAPRGGSIAYFGTSQPGHAVFVDPQNPAYCFSTDILRQGKIDRVPLKLITTRWGMKYRGWIDWTPTGALSLVPVTPPAPALPAASNPVSLSKLKPGLYNGSVRTVQAALKAEGLYPYTINARFDANTQSCYSKWQKKLGYSGLDANGIPGIKSLTALGKKHGFTVVA